jgi:hypothetical protein
VKTQTLIDLDHLVREGKVDFVSQKISEIPLSEVLRSDWALFANLSWRVGLGEIGLRLISPLIKEKRFGDALSEREIAEYANCLTAIGCSNEAIRLLSSTSKNIWSLQASGFAHISQWNYAAALKALEASCENKDIPPYTQLVNTVNISACLTFLGQWEKAISLIDCIEQNSAGLLSHRLKSNLIELRLQNLIGQSLIAEAHHLVKSFERETVQGSEKLFFMKWKAILNSIDDPSNGKQELFAARRSALHLKKWEVVRDLDFHIARIHESDTFLLRLYFATPFENYRKKILERSPKTISIPNSFSYRLLPNDLESDGGGDRSAEPTLLIDILNGCIGTEALKSGLLHHRLLATLSSDLYKPHSVGSLFQSVFPDEHYNPLTSANRVHQAIKGLRSILNKYRVNIEEVRGNYRLTTETLVSLLLPRKIDFSSRRSSRLGLIREAFPLEFTTKQVAQQLHCSIKTAQRLINEGLETGECVKVGQGGKTLFKWNTLSIATD